MNTSEQTRASTVAWLETFVIGMNLCPFAAKPWKRGQIRIEVCEKENSDEQVRFFLAELNTLIQSDAETISTSLLVYPHGRESFDDYLDLLDIAQELLEQAGLEGVIQLASFHPHYCFEGESNDAPGNFTNRAPYPLLHLIREEEMEAVLEVYPDPEAIPDNNIRKMESLGVTKLEALLEQCMDHQR